MNRFSCGMNVLIIVALSFLIVLTGCTSKDESLVAPTDTPEGTVYIDFEVHRNSLSITDVLFTRASETIDEAMIAVGLGGRGLIYPNDEFARPLLFQSSADFLGLYYYNFDRIYACGMIEDGSATLQLYDGTGWSSISHTAVGNFTGINNSYICSDAGEILTFPPAAAFLELEYQAPEGVRFNKIFCRINYEIAKPEVIAVGDDGAIFHRYENGEFLDESAPDGPDFIALDGAHTSNGPTEALAVSSHEIWLYQEGLWTRVYQNPGVVLNNIYYTSQDEAMAVGDGGLLLRGYGVDWAAESLGEDIDITAVGVGYQGADRTDFCGSQGEVVTSEGSVVNLNHHASGPWSAFFTTNDGTKYAANSNKLMRHEVDDWVEFAAWDWGRNITDFHVVAPDQIWAIGEMGDGVDHFVLFYNGNDWSLMNNSSLDKFNAIWCDAAGENVFVAADRGQIWRWNSGPWVPEVDLGTSDAFHALSGTDMENLLAVGDSGMIMRRGASGWSNETSNTSFALRAVNGPVIAGDGGTILKQSNGAWKNFGLEFDVRYNGVWSGPQDKILAVGDDASVMHFDGNDWTRLLTHLSGIDFLSVTGDGTDNTWIGGSEGYLLRTP